MSFYKIVFCFLLAFLFFSCAQQGILTGGDKDMQPPMVDTNKLENPVNRSTNFSANQIEINFNEYIVLQDPAKQIIITPFLSVQPTIFVKGKKVVIQFKSPLEANTTYIINFGDAIRDITEGNIFKNYKYVFSTGAYLDSLQYSTFVYDAFTKKPLADALVMLYKNQDDSVVKKQKPIYFAKTGANGLCKIENIAQSTYKVVVLADKNNNYLFDQDDEKIGFKTEPLIFEIVDTTAIKQDTLSAFLNTPSKKSITSTTYQRGKMTIAVNTPFPAQFESTLDSLKLWTIEGEITINSNRDSLSFWLLPEKNSKGEIRIPLGEYGSIKYKIIAQMETQPLKFNTNAFNNLKPKEALKIVFNEPIAILDTTKMILTSSGKRIPMKVKQKGKLELEISANFIEDESYEFLATPTAVTSIYGTTNDSLQFLFDQNSTSKFGSVTFTIEGNKINEHNGNFIVLLRQKNGAETQRLLKQNEVKHIHYENLMPGNYDFYIIFDSNNNGRWDSGDYFEKQLPERIEYFMDPIEIRKGWDAELKWIIN